MPHDFEGLHWAEHGHEFSAAVARLFSALITGIDRLQARVFDAPWKTERRGCTEL